MTSRAEIYFALAECFKAPTLEFARDVASGLLRQVLTEAFAEAGLSSISQALEEPGEPARLLEELRGAYHTLFSVPSDRFVLPVESVFKEWKGEQELAAGTGMIMGPPALDMLERYRARGLELPTEMKDYPDHLALLLEYGGILCRDADVQDQRHFVANHLDHWIDALADHMERLSEIRFHRAVAGALRTFVLAERRLLGLPEAP